MILTLRQCLCHPQETNVVHTLKHHNNSHIQDGENMPLCGCENCWHKNYYCTTCTDLHTNGHGQFDSLVPKLQPWLKIQMKRLLGLFRRQWTLNSPRLLYTDLFSYMLLSRQRAASDYDLAMVLFQALLENLDIQYSRFVQEESFLMQHNIRRYKQNFQVWTGC